MYTGTEHLFALGKVENCHPTGQYNYVHTSARFMFNDDMNFLVLKIYIYLWALDSCLARLFLLQASPATPCRPVLNFPTVFSSEALPNYLEHRPYREVDSGSSDQEIPL
jgi:hypothetical protein